jgi:glycosyltransferase involved in cell wall biosynthesis
VNVCRVARAFYPVVDGAAQHVWALSRAQADRGHRVWLLQPHVDAWPGTPPGLVIRRVPVGPLYGALYRSKAALAAFAILAGALVRSIHRRTALDVVHAHGDAIEAWCLGLWTRRLGVPLVLTIHGGLSARARYARWAPRMFRAVARFVVVGPTVRDQLVALGVSEARISVISSGIDLPRFPADAARPPRDELRVVTVGRLHAVKGYEFLIDAAARLGAAGRAVRVVIVGDGPERDRLLARAAGAAGVQFLGERSPADVAALLADADVFALPSVDIGTQSEGTPTAVMEAMAASLPVVVSDSGGLPLLVEDGVNGLVVPQRDATRLAEAIARLGDDRDLRRRMGARNRERMRAKDWSVIAEAIDAVYRLPEATHAVR